MTIEKLERAAKLYEELLSSNHEEKCIENDIRMVENQEEQTIALRFNLPKGDINAQHVTKEFVIEILNRIRDDQRAEQERIIREIEEL